MNEIGESIDDVFVLDGLVVFVDFGDGDLVRIVVFGFDDVVCCRVFVGDVIGVEILKLVYNLL